MIQTVLNPNSKLSLVRLLVSDLVLILFIYLIPTLSHLISIPLYIFDPMRIAIVFCIIYTNRRNTFLIALTVPLFSFIVSSHPVFYKSLLVALELFVNILLFYELSNRVKNIFIVMIPDATMTSASSRNTIFAGKDSGNAGDITGVGFGDYSSEFTNETLSYGQDVPGAGSFFNGDAEISSSYSALGSL